MSVIIRGDSGVVIIEGVANGGSNTGVVTSEKVSFKNKATSNPIEDGSNVNDHVTLDPTSFSITGILVGGDEARLTLEAMRDNRDLLEYKGTRELDNLVILSLDEDSTAQNKNGVGITISFQQMNLVASQKTDVKMTMPQQDASAKTSENTKAESNQGTKTTKSKSSGKSSSSGSSSASSTSGSTSASSSSRLASYNAGYDSKIASKLGK